MKAGFVDELVTSLSCFDFFVSDTFSSKIPTRALRKIQGCLCQGIFLGQFLPLNNEKIELEKLIQTTIIKDRMDSLKK